MVSLTFDISSVVVVSGLAIIVLVAVTGDVISSFTAVVAVVNKIALVKVVVVVLAVDGILVMVSVGNILVTVEVSVVESVVVFPEV